MEKYPDTYLLYEYMKKLPYTVRIKVDLTEPVDGTLLKQASADASGRFPYFAVRVELSSGAYVLKHNDTPIPVLPEENRRLVLGSAEVSGHLFAITWRENSIWFNFSHSVCGGFGAMTWVKTTLYRYLTGRYGQMDPPRDLRKIGEADEAELAYPDAGTLPADEPVSRYNGGNNNVGMMDFLKYILNPFAKNNYYYEIEIDNFMEVAKPLDASPNSLLSAVMLKTVDRLFASQKEKYQKKGEHLSARIAADYRDDIGCPRSYRDFVRFIHVGYDWGMGSDSIEKLNMRARGALIAQNQPELSYERCRKTAEAHEGIDAQPDLKSKKQYAAKHSTFRTDVRDTYTISYVGYQDWGGLAKYIRSVYTITDGNLMLEVNALPDKFCISFHKLSKDWTAVDLFCKAMEEAGLKYRISERKTRYLPEIRLPD